MKKPLADIYCRVSTKEQAEFGYSLDAQEQLCRRFALEKGYSVRKVYIERGESAKTTDRPVLQSMMTAFTCQAPSALIVYRLDRLTRDLGDMIQIQRFLDQKGVLFLSVTEVFEDSPAGKFLKNICGAAAQYENDVKRQRTIDAMGFLHLPPS